MRKNITEHFAWIVWQGLTCVNVSRCKIRYNTSPLNTGTNIDIIWKSVRSNLCFFPLNLCLTVDLLFLQVGKKSHDTSSRYLAFFSKLCWRQWFLPMLPSCVRTYVLGARGITGACMYVSAIELFTKRTSARFVHCVCAAGLRRTVCTQGYGELRTVQVSTGTMSIFWTLRASPLPPPPVWIDPVPG